MAKLEATPGIGAKALRFTILTALRSGAVRKATWDQFSENLTTWTIPAGNMKAGKEFVVPLPLAAIELLREVRDRRSAASPFVFASPSKPMKPISENTMAKVLNTFYPDATVHGMRSVFRDWAETFADPRAASLTRAVVFGAPDAVLMDLPQLTEDQPAHRPLVAAHAVPWPGEMAVFRSPATDGFELLTTAQSRARIGMLVSDFYAGPTSRFDLGNALAVDLLTGTLESVTDLTLLGGANALAIESAPGVWEIVQVGAAELLAPGRYRLTRLLRGQRGTEGAMGNPAPAGARVVVLDTALASLPIAEAELGLPWYWRIGPASRPVSDETSVAQSFTPAGSGLRPFSVAHVEQPWRTPRTPGDLTIRWKRRSRALSADSWGAVEVPMAEELEAYEVVILDGVTVKRVLSTTTTSAAYTAAQQTADWGAQLGPGESLTIRIFQLSALVGRGALKTVTLTF